MRRRDVFAALFAACACYAASKRASHARFEPFVRFDAIDASSVIASPRHTARALPTPAFDGERGFVFFARGVNATTIARATLAEDDGDASAKISRRRRRRNGRRRRRRRVTRARDEDDAVRARGMRALAETAVGREMDGFEEVDADDGVRASVAAKSKNAAAAGDDQRAVVIARGALADGRRVVVVVTRDFRVVCFDDGLRELWRREDAAPTGTRATEASVVVSSSVAIQKLIWNPPNDLTATLDSGECHFYLCLLPKPIISVISWECHFCGSLF